MLKFIALLFALYVVAAPVSPARGDESCVGFKWDVRKEQGLFAGVAAVQAAGKDVASAPSLGTDRLYELKLAPQGEVLFNVEPGRKSAADGSYAGMAVLNLPRPGDYRVALDLPAWIDVAGDGKLATVEDFQGQRGCDGPHKIVAFDLTGAKLFVLQISGASKEVIRVTVTQAPASR